MPWQFKLIDDVIKLIMKLSLKMVSNYSVNYKLVMRRRESYLLLRADQIVNVISHMAINLSEILYTHLH